MTTSDGLLSSRLRIASLVSLPMALAAPALAIALAGPALAAQSGPDARVAGVPTKVSWKVYTPGNTGVQGDYVQAIFVDRDDHPWIAGYTPIWEQGGMAHFDGDRWTNLSNVDHPKILSPRFNDIEEDANGLLWIASDAGLLRYDPARGPASLVRFDPANTPMPADQVRDVAVAPDGAIWLAIHDVQSVPSGGLVRHDPAAGTWSVWTTSSGLPWGAQWPGWDWIDFVSVVPDPDGGFTVWFGSDPIGMATLKNGSMTWYGVPSQLPFNAPLTPVGLPSARVVDDLGNLWVETNKGLARRAPEGTYTVMGYPPSGSTSCVFALSGGRAIAGSYYSAVDLWDGSWISLGSWGSGNHTYAFAEDSTGAIWTGGIGGAAKYENGAWQRYRLMNTGMFGYFLRTLDFDAAGTLYMNGNAGPGVGGFHMFDGVHWTGVNNYNYGLGPAWGLPSDDVEALVARANGHLLLAPAGLQGLYDWDGASYQQLIPQGFDILEVDEDGLGRAWAAHGGGGVSLVTGEGRVQFTNANSPLPVGDIGSVVADDRQAGWVWIAAQYGIAHTNGATWQVYPRELLGLTPNSIGYFISSLEPAGDGTLWVGAGQGLYRFHPQTLTYEQYTPANSGLPSSNVGAIELAPDGSVWVTTFDMTYPYPGGLTHYDGRRWTTYTMQSSPLPHNQISDLVARRTPRGYEVWVATASEGLAVVSVERELPKPVVR
jgi:ligand-binding sensor domain-containing protein